MEAKETEMKLERQIIEEVARVPQEVKQKIIDMIRDCKTVGEARKAVGLDLIIVCRIICDNIETVEHISKLREVAI